MGGFYCRSQANLGIINYVRHEIDENTALHLSEQSGLAYGCFACLLIQNMMHIEFVGCINNGACPVHFAGIRMPGVDQRLVAKNLSRVGVYDRMEQAK